MKSIIFNKKARISLGVLFLLAGVLSIMLAYLVLGAHTSSPSSVTVNLSQNYRFNITVNNTATGTGGDTTLGNITIINITLPSGFSLIANTNMTSAIGIFSNTSSILTWTNQTLFLINGSANNTNFLFNATITSIPGNYNISVRSINATGFTDTNVSVVVNDITAPVLTLFSPTNGNTTISAPGASFVFNVSDSSATNCTLILNGNIVSFNSSVNITGGNNVFTNSSYSVDNTWNVNCTDSYNNIINSSIYNFSFTSFAFNGTTRDENGSVLASTVVNMTVRNQNGWGVLAYIAGISNASGWFSFNIPSNISFMFEPSMLHNTTTIDFKSKIIPAFPQQMMSMLAGTTFYLSEAATINITAINASGNRTLFNYQIKDTKLGYSIASEFTTMSSEVNVYVPKNRNYSIMIYPNQSMPISYDWSNFSSPITNNLSVGSELSMYNVTTRTLHKQFNISMSMARVSGYLKNISGAILNITYQNWTNFTVIPYLMEPGNMIHADFGDMPYNLSTAVGQSDLINLTSGFYNISLPATVETSNIMLIATAKNGTYYGGFRNISLSYEATARQVNFTMFGLLGSETNVTMNRMEPGVDPNIAIPTAKQTFNLVNASNSTLTSTGAHIEATYDYSAYNATEFTWMLEIAQSAASATFSLPMLNVTGVKEINVYASGGPGGGDSGQYAPKRVGVTSATQILTNNNITMKLFSPGSIDASVAASSISMAMYYSNSTCDVANPPASCLLGGSNSNTTRDQFNPMQAVMGGGKISFRMGTGGILVHYVNVDLLASGPPDAMFDGAASTGTSGSSFSSALRFGSQGPTIYDYVLVSIPYSETVGSGLNDSAQVSISIPVLYDDNWRVIWNVTANGTNAANLAGNHSHYSTYQNDWGNLTSSKVCSSVNLTTSSMINSTNPCYIDNSTNRVWIRLPHFSGTGPSISGSVITAAASSSTSTSTSSGGGGATASYWTLTVNADNNKFTSTEGYTTNLATKQRVKVSIDNNGTSEEHYVGVISISDNSVTINVSSDPQTATLLIGENKSFEVTGDNYYDIKVTLNSISSNKANLSVAYLHELMPEGAASTTGETGAVEGETATGESAKSTTAFLKKYWIWIVIALAVIIAIVVYKSTKKRN